MNKNIPKKIDRCERMYQLSCSISIIIKLYYRIAKNKKVAYEPCKMTDKLSFKKIKDPRLESERKNIA